MNIKTFNSSENDTLPYVGNWDPHDSMNESDKVTHKIISIDPKGIMTIAFESEL